MNLLTIETIETSDHLGAITTTVEEYEASHDDDLGTVRGIIAGIVSGSLLWFGIVWLIRVLL